MHFSHELHDSKILHEGIEVFQGCAVKINTHFIAEVVYYSLLFIMFCIFTTIEMPIATLYPDGWRLACNETQKAFYCVTK